MKKSINNTEAAETENIISTDEYTYNISLLINFFEDVISPSMLLEVLDEAGFRFAQYALDDPDTHEQKQAGSCIEHIRTLRMLIKKMVTPK